MTITTTKEAKEIRDDRPLDEKATVIAKGLLAINGYLSANELHKCIEMLKDPELVFVGEVHAQSPLRIQIRDMDGRRFFRFFIPKPINAFFDDGTITEVPTLEAAKAFFKGYMSWEKVQSKLKSI